MDKKNETYKHFNTIEECEWFVRQMMVQNYIIIGRCCGGKGVCVRESELHQFIHKQNNPIKPVRQKNLKKTQDDCCCVCLETCNEVTQCGHLVCATCAVKVKPSCPYCRQPM